MRINVNGPPIEEFTPMPHVKSWISGAKGTRHIQEHSKTKTKERNERNDVNKKQRKILID